MNMPKIKEIKVLPYNLDLTAPLAWGREDELRRLRHALVRVELSDGAVGVAEATPRPSIYGETQASIAHIIDEELAPRLLGRSVSDFASVAALSADCASIKNNNTAKGALDMALHQALARSRGERLAQYLGAAQAQIRLSYIVSAGPPSAVLSDVAGAYRAGIRVFKVKIGRNLPQEIETLERLLALYPAAQFYVDANQTLRAANAQPVLRQLHEMGILYCEEPLPIQQLLARQQLRRAGALPLIADDSAFTVPDLEREIAFDTFDILNIKTARNGFSQARRMLKMCRDQGKSVMVGSQASSILGCLHAALFAACEGVDCASECSFYLKTEGKQQRWPEIVAGYLRIDAAEKELASLQNFYASE